MRLAWFGPVPPVRSGIAACSRGLLDVLGRTHAIDVFVDEPAARAATGGAVRSAHEFPWRHRQARYDLAVYQLGNSSHHDYLWPYLFRYPGLAVLHDAHLHHARAAALLREGRRADYRAEFAANHPEAPAAAAELAVAGFDSPLLYEWPFVRLVAQASRLLAVHSRIVCTQLQVSLAPVPVEYVRLGHGAHVAPGEAQHRSGRARARLGIPPDARVFGLFGGLTPEKRIPQVLDAFAAVMPYVPDARLLLAGAPAGHYDVVADVAARGLRDRVTVTGYLDTEDDLIDCIAASDVSVNLRWPTAREISGPWLQALGAGRPTIVMDLAHTADLPALDPRTWMPTHRDGRAPVAVAIDVLDEVHSLTLAMRRLARDPDLRHSLGAAAHAYWAAEHVPDAMADDYRRLIARAAALPPPLTSLPPHVRADGSARLHRLLGGLNVAVPWSTM